MAGGSSPSARELDQTPTWAVGLVCAVIVIISILLEKVLHHIGEVIINSIFNFSCEYDSSYKHSHGFIFFIFIFPIYIR